MVRAKKTNNKAGAGKCAKKMIVTDRCVNRTLRIGAGESLTYVLFNKAGWTGSPKIKFVLEGKGAELKFYAFIVGKGAGEFGFETVSVHKARETKAEFTVKSAMFDSSVIDYKGNIVIEKTGHMTDAHLYHHTLLMSDGARAKTLPALEIMTDDVKAGHGATVGRLNKEDMFYLMCRGLEEKEAESVLVKAFFEGTINLIGESNVVEKVAKSIRGALTER